MKFVLSPQGKLKLRTRTNRLCRVGWKSATPQHAPLAARNSVRTSHVLTLTAPIQVESNRARGPLRTTTRPR